MKSELVLIEEDTIEEISKFIGEENYYKDVQEFVNSAIEVLLDIHEDPSKSSEIDLGVCHNTMFGRKGRPTEKDKKIWNELQKDV